MQNKKKVQLAAAGVRKKSSELPEARIGLILGTGLGDLCNDLVHDVVIPYETIPNFPSSTVSSHAGALSHSSFVGVPVWILQGRFHLYEGYTPEEVCMGVRTLATLGVDTLLMTNAAGALNPGFSEGGLMCLSDQINFTGTSPLEGSNEDSWGPRFPDMCGLYTPRLRELAMKAALDQGIRLEQGVYVGVRGPSLETPAETRMYRMLGADAIGMSTVLEAVAARHMGLELLGISCLTNKNLPDCMQQVSFESVLATAAEASQKLAKLLSAVVQRLAAAQ